MVDQDEQIDTSRCPLCREDNGCASLKGYAEQCWCMSVKVPRAALQQVPQELQGISCICQSCATRYGSEVEAHSALGSSEAFFDAAPKESGR